MALYLSLFYRPKGRKENFYVIYYHCNRKGNCRSGYATSKRTPELNTSVWGLLPTREVKAEREEPIFYQCYCNKFLADRLIKAGVKKSTCLMVYGDLELHPYIHQKGNNAGQGAITPQIMVKDWQFLIANRNDTNAATPVPGNPMVGNPNVPPVPKKRCYFIMETRQWE